MKGIQLLLVVKIIRVEYGNVKRRGGVIGLERESVCVCEEKDLNCQKRTLSFEKKKTLERRWCFFLKVLFTTNRYCDWEHSNFL